MRVQAGRGNIGGISSPSTERLLAEHQINGLPAIICRVVSAEVLEVSWLTFYLESERDVEIVNAFGRHLLRRSAERLSVVTWRKACGARKLPSEGTLVRVSSRQGNLRNRLLATAQQLFRCADSQFH